MKKATKTKATKAKRTVRGPQLDLVREAKGLRKSDAEFELLPMPSDNAMTAAGGAMAVASFRLPAATRAELDALVARHVARTKADVVRIAVAALAKASGVKAVSK